MDRTSTGGSWARTSRSLFLVALAVFVITVAIGILNGLDLVEFPRDLLLTHVHGGTLGWITLGVAATACWVFGGMDRRVAVALATATPIYVLAFASGSYPLRAATGVFMLAVVVAFLAWAWRAWLLSDRSLVALALALGITTFTYGAVVGVLLQLQFAFGTAWLSGDSIGAHAAAMVFSYLVLVAMGVVEWRLTGSRARPRAGVVELGALFVGGLVLSVGLLAGAGQAAGGLYLLLNLVAVVLFAVRVLPRAAGVRWVADVPATYAAVSAIWIVVALAIFMYLVAQYVMANGDASKISPNILVASDHATFVGVMTNLAFGVIAALTLARSGGTTVERLVLAVMNVGLAVFVVGLAADVAEVKRIGAPVMGIAIVAGMALYALRLWRLRQSDEAPT